MRLTSEKPPEAPGRPLEPIPSRPPLDMTMRTDTGTTIAVTAARSDGPDRPPLLLFQGGLFRWQVRDADARKLGLFIRAWWEFPPKRAPAGKEENA